MRSKAIQQQKETGPHPYPHKFSVSLSLAAFIEQYQHLECGEQLEDEVLNIAGEWSTSGGRAWKKRERKNNVVQKVIYSGSLVVCDVMLL